MTVKHTPGPPVEWKAYDAAGYCVIHSTGHRAALRTAAPDMLAALADIELRVTQATIASTIGKKKDRTDFLRGELERMASQARAAIEKAEGRT